ncbi:MAG: GNAT family N-acetyltransferase [Steroidobacterales bacterium]
MRSAILSRIDEVSASAWNALAGDYPFLRHEFLAALEHSGCVGGRSGWQPHHLALFDQHGLAAAAPLYLKTHSWGEFVFDFGWARAAEAHGVVYYPKLLIAVPFTPASGPRLLCRPSEVAEVAGAPAVPNAPAEQLRAQLLAAAADCMRAGRYSSVHALFLDEAARASCAAAGWLLRRDCHFQWRNRGYRDFEDFLGGLSAEKRKKAKRERRRVLEQGIEFVSLHGAQLDAALLDRIYGYHALTFARHGHAPYLNRDFFERMARALDRSFMVKLALRAGKPVAAAMFLRSSSTLYGRYWGAEADYHSLHFEACYYQGIDYCIEHGLQRFEPGTQGEHKIARGFESALTWSAHWLEDAGLRRAVAQHLAREAVAIDAYAAEVDAHAPYRKSDAGKDDSAAPP